MISLQRARLAAAAFSAGMAFQLPAVPSDRARPSAEDPLASELQVLLSDRAPVDMFHPDRAPDAQGRRPLLPAPALGGSVNLLLESMPAHLNYAIGNAAVMRRVLNELHAFLMQQDWNTLELRPVLAEQVILEDVLVLRQESWPRHPEALERERIDSHGQRERVRVLFGTLLERADGEWELRARPGPAAPPSGLRLPKADVAERVRGGAVTFLLHPNVYWHPAPGFEKHALDARDVVFSWELYTLPGVHCDAKRSQFQRVIDCQAVGPLEVRFLLGQTHFQSLEALGEMTLLPSHLYDLHDPQHPRHDPTADQQARAEEINGNPCNRRWVGLGPYRLEELGTGTITAVRFEDYFDPSDSGYLDRIRWRVLGDDQAFTALEAGDLDFCDRISSERFFGPATQSAAMARRYYRGYSYQGVFTFFAWNMRQPPFDDERVRLAMAHCFDLEAFKHSYYHGLVNVVTGPFPYFSSAYAHDVAPPALDFARAEELLALAGWYDRDGDGRVDRDGRALAFDLLLPAGNEASKQNGLVLQEGLRRVGVECRLAVLDWVPLQKRYSERDFEATALAWVPDVETDPEPNWHSRWAAPEVAGSNAVGMADAEVDRLIAAGQAELDPARRAAIWRDLHRRIAQLQPFLFQYNPPRKFLMNRALRGHQTSRIDPGYVIRRWYYPEGTPGTRALEARRR